jgi:hypothetical protein
MATVSPKDVEKAIKGIDFPARKQDLIKCAEKNNADEMVREVLKKLPDETFNKPTDVAKAIGEMDRGQRP